MRASLTIGAVCGNAFASGMAATARRQAVRAAFLMLMADDNQDNRCCDVQQLIEIKQSSIGDEAETALTAVLP